MKRVIFSLAGAAILILIFVLALATRHAPAFSPGQKAVLNRAVTCHATTIEAGTPVVVIGTSLDRLYVGVRILSKEPGNQSISGSGCGVALPFFKQLRSNRQRRSSPPHSRRGLGSTRARPAPVSIREPIERVRSQFYSSSSERRYQDCTLFQKVLHDMMMR